MCVVKYHMQQWVTSTINSVQLYTKNIGGFSAI